MNPAAIEVTTALSATPPGKALDLACGSGRHSLWLRDRGWSVTAIDIAPVVLPGVEFERMDLEKEGSTIRPAAWDLIVCWLYWQPNLLPSIAAGIREGGIAALCGKVTGRFATSLAQYRAAFDGWAIIASGEDDFKAFFIVRKPTVAAPPSPPARRGTSS